MEVSYQRELLEAGCDEAGRGCLAGPVFAAAVILPEGFAHPLLNDSKQVSEEHRNLLRPIIERQAVAWAVAMVSHRRIDRINILNASIEAMNLAVGQLGVRPGFLAVDGNRFRCELGIPFRCIVKGDARYANIAAASILAKTHRDQYMENIAEQYPAYCWKNNKGYPTQAHRRAIETHGLSPYHRRTFGTCADQLSLF
ncbi:MAG: ribonuclease HII [Alistipes sp.]|nr:ribonuclease HII [Alistipes sp.]